MPCALHAATIRRTAAFESRVLEGLENVEEIAAVEGIDMTACGHSDLSAQLGVHLDLERPDRRAYDDALRKGGPIVSVAG